MLLLILSAIMSWFVTSKNSVSGEGEYPSGIEVNYTCTYQKGDVREADTASISFANMGTISIERIEVYVKSNKTAGAGKFTVVANGEAVATKAGTFKDWVGAYDNSEYHAISLLSAPLTNVRNLSVELVGTANSLHIEKYVIQYTSAPPHTVTLMVDGTKFDVLTEKAGGKGIDLPWANNISSWDFAGWSETEFWEIEALPPVPLIYPGQKYYPQDDCTLWAVYKQDRTPAMSYVTELMNDVYLYLNSQTDMALSGVPDDGIMECVDANVCDYQQYYLIEFQGSDTAYITHMMSDTPIGYSNDKKPKLIAAASPWKVYHDGEETLFYATISNENYILWPRLMDEGGYTVYSGLFSATPGTFSSPIRLQSIIMPAQLYVYTCHPLAQGIDIPNEGMNEVRNEQVLMHFGNFDLILKNGKKELRLR